MFTRPHGLSTCFILPGLARRRVICHAQFRILSGITLLTRSTDTPSNHDLEVLDRFSTFWLARSIPSASALDAFRVLHTGFLTALMLISRVLSVGQNFSHTLTNLASTLFSPTWLKMLHPTPNDSRLLSLVLDLRLTRRDHPSLSCLHPRACLPEACVPDPLSLHSVTWTEDVLSVVLRV